MLVQTREITDEFDLFMCIQCGKCTGGCPIASITNFNLRDLLYHLLIEDEYDLNEGEMLWDCTTCFTCSTRCPKDVHPADAIIALRRILVEKRKVPRSISQALMSTFRYGNPFEMRAEERGAWGEGLGLKNALEEPVDVLYYTGCMPSYEPRLKRVARALVRGLTSAGVEVGTLGLEESCCGSEVRRLGEQALFEMIIEEGAEVLSNALAEQMITTSPHCFDVFTRHYPNPGYPIIHYTQYVCNLIENGKLRFREGPNVKVTYHDPCYLGRQNKIYDEPRAILRSIPGVELVEMDRSRETSLCCEGGGGRMWFEGSGSGVRLASKRVNEAIDTGAEVLATACPFCLMMLGDTATAMGAQIEVKDIMELVVEAL